MSTRESQSGMQPWDQKLTDKETCEAAWRVCVGETSEVAGDHRTALDNGAAGYHGGEGESPVEIVPVRVGGM